jgi:hypothetical protein
MRLVQLMFGLSQLLSQPVMKLDHPWRDLDLYEVVAL